MVRFLARLFGLLEPLYLVLHDFPATHKRGPFDSLPVDLRADILQPPIQVHDLDLRGFNRADYRGERGLDCGALLSIATAHLFLEVVELLLHVVNLVDGTL